MILSDMEKPKKTAELAARARRVLTLLEKHEFFCALFAKEYDDFQNLPIFLLTTTKILL